MPEKLEKPLAVFNFLQASNAIVVDLTGNPATISGAVKCNEENAVDRLHAAYPFKKWSTVSALVVGQAPAKCIEELHMQEVHYVDALDDFLKLYPFLRAGDGTHVEPPRLNYPTELIPNALFIGSKDHAHNPGLLRQLNITRIVRLLENTPETEDASIMHVTIDDLPTEKLPIEEMVLWIQEQIAAKHRVLVHCNLGVSRAATTCIAYVMKDAKVPLQRAYSFVEKQRPCIRPNAGFVEQLQAWEKKLGLS
eukprot:GEMP01035969.1.p1 GENE.GEMP01035969.1~~GEMP01035969.1.p1  ORF type:complete len:251 (+),score=64.85 GEMP01035969.1:308-1060(+)